MAHLPVIVGFGGVNPAGRLSMHHAYRRMVLDQLSEHKQNSTYASLAGLMGIAQSAGDASAASESVRAQMRDSTLIRRIEHFDPRSFYCHRHMRLRPEDGDSTRFTTRRRLLPREIPENWTVREIDRDRVEIEVHGDLVSLIPDKQPLGVSSAGQLPSGFNPAEHYQSRSHPKGLQLAVFGASDALNSLGLDWSAVQEKLRPDQTAVFAGSCMSQLDNEGNGGLLQAPLLGKRTSAKQLTLGLVDMPGAFVNAYVLGSVGLTGACVGACATYLFNLQQAVLAIREGRCRLAIAGGAEAPLTPYVIEGFRTMGALGTDEDLRALDGADEPDHRRACRPFAENIGFTLSEACAFAVLMDDDLAMELGLPLYGAVPGIYCNADGFKHSIPGPGIGNYLTVAKAMSLGRSMLGEESLRQRSYVHAHGTGTPQNRVTESHILSELAKTFGIDAWPVAAVKSMLGHSLACASGDQLIASLGTWEDGIIPGIPTIREIADDVHQAHLAFAIDPIEVGTEGMDMAMVNSKGFGGNNATALVLAPHIVEQLLRSKHGDKAMLAHKRKLESTQGAREDYDKSAKKGDFRTIYKFGEDVIKGEDLELGDQIIGVPGFENPVALESDHPFGEYLRPD